MNPTLLKIALAYIAGLLTYELFQHHSMFTKVKNIETKVLSLNSGVADSSDCYDCACNNAERYNVDPRDDSKNYPIPSVPECRTMVHNANPVHKGVTPTGYGAWFSKITLDNMFCNMPDANGVYVYKAVTDEGLPTYVIEAARTNMILSTDDGTSYIYYSRTMCPTVCGVCGM